PCSSWAILVNPPRYEFLPCSRGSLDEDRQVRRSDAMEEAEKPACRRACALQRAEGVALSRPLACGIGWRNANDGPADVQVLRLGDNEREHARTAEVCAIVTLEVMDEHAVGMTPQLEMKLGDRRISQDQIGCLRPTDDNLAPKCGLACARACHDS